MSAATLERVCEPFFTTKPLGKGTGLGLAMVYGFVKQSGGAVRMSSQPGSGTTVLLYLPLTKDSKAVRGAKTVPAAVGRVLLVDDEPELLEISLAYLAELGYIGSKARNGAEALEVLAQQGPFDLLVTDIAMPGGLNGAELAQMVQELSPKTRVIYSSGFTPSALAAQKVKLDDGPLLQKPFRRAEFGAAIRQVMEQRMNEPAQMSLPGEERVRGVPNG
jgi:CheY-like chemotaxis protein